MSIVTANLGDECYSFLACPCKKNVALFLNSLAYTLGVGMNTYLQKFVDFVHEHQAWLNPTFVFGEFGFFNLHGRMVLSLHTFLLNNKLHESFMPQPNLGYLGRLWPNFIFPPSEFGFSIFPNEIALLLYDDPCVMSMP